MLSVTYNSLYGSRFLNTYGLDNLKYVYNTLHLTKLNGIHQGAKYARATNSVAVWWVYTHDESIIIAIASSPRHYHFSLLPCGLGTRLQY